MIDLYYERSGPGLFEEPYNVLSNGAFLVSAVLLIAARRRDTDRAVDALICLVALIGLGSASFHVFATVWAQALDVLPIAVFQIIYIWTYLRRNTPLEAPLVYGTLAAFLLVSGIGTRIPEFLNGSLSYILAGVMLMGFGIHQWQTEERRMMLGAALLFLIALVFRTVDHEFSGTMPMGTHFLWHVLTASVLYLAVRSVQIPARAAE